MVVCIFNDCSFLFQCSNAEDAVLVRSNSQDDGLTSHPAKKLVMDFLRVIVVDSLSLTVTVTNKTPPVIDLVLEVTELKLTH